MNSQNDLIIYEATTFLQRLRGLIGRRKLNNNEALRIAACSIVHSFGMHYTLDIVFLSKAGKVLNIKALKPNFLATCYGANCVIELKAGCAEHNGLFIGMLLNVLNPLNINVMDDNEKTQI